MLGALVSRHPLRKRPGASQFLLNLAPQVTEERGLDPISQLQELHELGFDLASKMIADLEWSSRRATARWGNGQKRPVRCIAENLSGTFLPETTDREILFKVRQNTFEFKNALLEYLKIDYEFMHEYVSHVLPVWKSAGGRLEEELLLVCMNRYYWAGDRYHNRELVDIAEEYSKDGHKEARRRLKGVELAIGPRRLSQIMVEIAVTPEADLEKSEKDEFLAVFLQNISTFRDRHPYILMNANVVELSSSFKHFPATHKP